MTKRLAGIVWKVQRRHRYQFDLTEVVAVLDHTLRKVEMNCKGEDYIPVLFENELEDLIMRKNFGMRGDLVV